MGGNFFVDKKDFGFIVGVEESATFFITPDFAILNQAPLPATENTPIATTLLSVSSIQDVDKIVVETNLYKPINFISIPPFLLDSVSQSIESSEGNSKQVLVDVAKRIKDFDTLHAGDNEYVDKAKLKSKEILFLFYFKVMDKIQAIPTIGCNNRAIISKLNELQDRVFRDDKNNINLNEHLDVILKRPLALLDSSSSAT